MPVDVLSGRQQPTVTQLQVAEAAAMDVSSALARVGSGTKGLAEDEAARREVAVQAAVGCARLSRRAARSVLSAWRTSMPSVNCHSP